MLSSLISWAIIGGLTGWVGFLATKPHSRNMTSFVAFGALGGVLGGLLSDFLEISERDVFLDPTSLLIALGFSALFVFLYATCFSSKKQ